MGLPSSKILKSAFIIRFQLNFVKKNFIWILVEFYDRIEEKKMAE